MSDTGFALAIILFDVLTVGGLFWKMPDWSRPEILFSVTVTAETRRGASAAAILAGFRRRVVLASVAALVLSSTALAALGGGAGDDVAAAVLGLTTVAHTSAMIWAFLRARRETRPLAAAPTAVREAAVSRPAHALPGGPLGQGGPFALLAALTLFLALRWPAIPARIVTHWDADFGPDAVRDKTALLVFGFPVVGLVFCGLLWLVARVLLNAARRVHLRGPAAAVESGRHRAIALLLLGLGYVLAATFALLGLVPLAQTPTTARALALAVLAVSVAGPLVLVIGWLVRFGAVLTAGARAAEAAGSGQPIGDRTEDRFWKWGLVYYNPDDPVLWVEKRFGVGYTINLGRPAARWIAAALIGIPLLVTAIVLLAT